MQVSACIEYNSFALNQPLGFVVLETSKMDQVQKDTGMEEGSEHTDNNMSQSQSQSATSQDQMQKCRQWLMSIPRQDVADLQHTQEYRDFIRAFERLSSVNRSGAFRNQKRLSLMALEEGETGAMAEVAGHNNSTSENEYYSSPTIEIQRDKHFSFLQHMADDDIIIRMFEFLDSQTLVRVSMTCSRFHELALESAAQRTHEIAETRQLNNVFHLLRAQEQIDGIGTGLQDRHVRVPVLLLGRRVTVTGAGDPEYNGLYFCTGSNGNGFIFTKPRFPERRIIRVQGQLRTRENIADAVQRDRLEREVALPGKQLRCIISKRFSNEVWL